MMTGMAGRAVSCILGVGSLPHIRIDAYLKPMYTVFPPILMDVACEHSFHLLRVIWICANFSGVGYHFPVRRFLPPFRMPGCPSWAPVSCRRSCNRYHGPSPFRSPPSRLWQTIAHSAHALRDPSQHASLKAEIEAQSSSLYATARLWDDGIIKPTDTRDVVGLGLALAARQSASPSRLSGSSGSTWDGEGRGFGVYRM